MRINPGGVGFTSGFSQEHAYSIVGEQITVEQLIELSIVMRLSRCRCQNRRISGRGSRTVRLGGW